MEPLWLLLLLWRKGHPVAPVATPAYSVHLLARGQNDRASRRFLASVERMGTVKSMSDFDGRNIDLIWVPRPELYNSAGASGAPLYVERLRQLVEAGTVRIIQVKETTT